LRWEWCPWVFLGENSCLVAYVAQHSSIDRRLWFAYGNYAAYVKLFDNPTAEATPDFAASGFLRMSYTQGTNPEWDKMFSSVVMERKGCASGKSVQVKYRKDTDTTATVCSAALITNGVVETNLTQSDASTALAAGNIPSNRIQFELHFLTTAATVSPEVSYFEAKGAEKPEMVRIHEATYKITTSKSDASKTIRDWLRTARTSTSLLRFADYRWGTPASDVTTADGKGYVWVVLEPGYPKEIEVRHEKGAQPELGVQVRLREVSYTIA